MTVERSPCNSVNQLDHIAILNALQWLRDHQFANFGLLDNPPIVYVFERVARNLLLMT